MRTPNDYFLVNQRRTFGFDPDWFCIYYSNSNPKAWLLITEWDEWVRVPRHQARRELQIRRKITRWEAEFVLDEILHFTCRHAHHAKWVREEYRRNQLRFEEHGL
jgi:hypothetical protein